MVPSGVDPNLKTPTVESYSLKIEQQIAPNTSLSVGYIGSHGYHELLSVDQNLPNAPYPYATQVVTAASTGLANPALWNSTNWVSEGISSYNGLQVDVNHRISHGLQFRGAYTFSKSLDNGDSMNTSVATNSPAFVANPLNLHADYGRASFDVLAAVRRCNQCNVRSSFWKRCGGKSMGEPPDRELADQRDRNHTVRPAFHAATLLQPVERWRHAQSGSSLVEPGFHRSRNSGRAQPVF